MTTELSNDEMVSRVMAKAMIPLINLFKTDIGFLASGCEVSEAHHLTFKANHFGRNGVATCFRVSIFIKTRSGVSKEFATYAYFGEEDTQAYEFAKSFRGRVIPIPIDVFFNGYDVHNL